MILLKDVFGRSINNKSLFKVLEIGCNNGTFIEYLQSQFPQAEFEGIELNQSCIDFCNKRNRFKLYNRPLEKIDFPPKCYDAIMIYHLLEHVQYPLEFIRRLKPLLKDQGVINIAVPNTDNVYTQIMGPIKRLKGKEVFYSMSPPFHLHGFNLKNIKQLFLKEGFKEIESQTYSHLPYKGTFLGGNTKIHSFSHLMGRTIAKISSLAKDDCLVASYKFKAT